MKYFVEFDYYIAGWKRDEDFGEEHPEGASFNECVTFIESDYRETGYSKDRYLIVDEDGNVVVEEAEESALSHEGLVGVPHFKRLDEADQRVYWRISNLTFDLPRDSEDNTKLFNEMLRGRAVTAKSILVFSYAEPEPAPGAVPEPAPEPEPEPEPVTNGLFCVEYDGHVVDAETGDEL